MEIYLPAIITGGIAAIGLVAQYLQFKKQIKETKRLNALSYLADSRGRWINTTREYFSEYISSVRKLMDYERYYVDNKIKSAEDTKEMTNLKSDNIRCRTILLTSFNIRDENDLDSKIINTINLIEEMFGEYYNSLVQLDSERNQKLVDAMQTKVEELRELVSQYFKNEWERIKIELES